MYSPFTSRGAGKSSLAFDTLYAEGKRRYVESLSSYARQFLGRMKKPECSFIEGLPPTIAIGNCHNLGLASVKKGKIIVFN